jgi:hypothetical protein
MLLVLLNIIKIRLVKCKPGQYLTDSVGDGNTAYEEIVVPEVPAAPLVR